MIITDDLFVGHHLLGQEIEPDDLHCSGADQDRFGCARLSADVGDQRRFDIADHAANARAPVHASENSGSRCRSRSGLRRSSQRNHSVRTSGPNRPQAGHICGCIWLVSSSELSHNQ